MLTQPKALRLLTPFMRAECTVGGAAAMLGVSNHALQYWVRKFVELELLVETRRERRAGKALRYYRATAAQYFVPFAAIERLTLDALMERAEAPWLAALHANFLSVIQGNYPNVHGWGLWLSVNEADGWPRFDVGPPSGPDDRLGTLLRDADGPAVLACWVPLKLEFGDAKAFQRELGALLERYSRKTGAQPYLARIALAPLMNATN